MRLGISILMLLNMLIWFEIRGYNPKPIMLLLVVCLGIDIYWAFYPPKKKEARG